MGDVARTFGAATDQIVVSRGGFSAPPAAVTFGFVMRPNFAAANADVLTIPASSGYYSLFVTSARKFELFRNGGGGNPVSLTALTTAGTDWWAVFVTKAAGTATPRFHFKDLTTGAAWVHEDATATTIDSSATGSSIDIGKGTLFASSAIFDLAGAAVWNSALSDAQIEALISSNRASTSVWLAASPQALWVLDQSSTATAVTDQTGGGATETAHTGTSVLSSTGNIPWDASSSVTYTDAPSGTATTAGTLTQSYSHSSTPSGGPVASGGLTESLVYADVVTGGPTASGSVTQSASFADTVSGGPASAGFVTENVLNLGPDAPVDGGYRIGVGPPTRGEDPIDYRSGGL